MSRAIGKLTAVKVKTSKPGMYADGGGLYLQVTHGGAKSWIFRFMLNGRAREMGLGSASALSLADARAKAAECRRSRQEGIDPIEARKAERARLALEAASLITFRQAAERYIASHRPGWRNEKHAAQWTNTLTAYAMPVIGPISVQAIDTTLVLRILEPIWSTKPETASRVRGRIEAVLDWAAAQGLRTGANPARWKGHLSKLLPALSKVRAVKHHAALPYDELPKFMQDLRQQNGIGARALELTILTAARTGETIGAHPDEFNLKEKVWIVPPERMKAKREHRVPLCPRAAAIVEEMKSAGDHPFLFPGGRPNKPLSNMAMAAVLKRMKRDTITVHGFRSTFRDWAAERTNFPNEVVEMAMSHAIEN